MGSQCVKILNFRVEVQFTLLSASRHEDSFFGGITTSFTTAARLQIPIFHYKYASASEPQDILYFFCKLEISFSLYSIRRWIWIFQEEKRAWELNTSRRNFQATTLSYRRLRVMIEGSRSTYTIMSTATSISILYFLLCFHILLIFRF